MNLHNYLIYTLILDHFWYIKQLSKRRYKINYTKKLLIFMYYTKIIVSGFQFENAINIDFSKAIADL